MRIVMFSDAYWPRVNGVTVSVDSYSRALVKAGHEVLIICSSYPESLDTPTLENMVRIVRVPSFPAFITKEDRIAKLSKWHWVFRQVESFNPDIVHVNTEFFIAELGFLYARAHNLPAIYTFHTMWEDYGPNYFPMFPAFIIKFIARVFLKNILGRFYRVIVPTPQIDEVVHRYRPMTKTFLLPTGIEPELFERDREEGAAFREKLEERFPLLKGKKLLLFAGRVVKEKNLAFLFEVLRKVLTKEPDTLLLFAGSGPDIEYYQEMAKKLKFEAHSVFTGYMERKDLALTYMISEVFVFPSLTDTQGLVTLEAMLSGTPVVAIGALGTLMVMGGDNGGFMVKHDVDEFSGRVLELLGDPELMRRKSQEAKERARAWSIGELTKKLAEFYEATIKDYLEDYGEPRKPVWDSLLDKRWWKINNQIFRKKTKRIWQKMRAKMKMEGAD